MACWAGQSIVLLLVLLLSLFALCPVGSIPFGSNLANWFICSQLCEQRHLSRISCLHVAPVVVGQWRVGTIIHWMDHNAILLWPIIYLSLSSACRRSRIWEPSSSGQQPLSQHYVGHGHGTLAGGLWKRQGSNILLLHICSADESLLKCCQFFRIDFISAYFCCTINFPCFMSAWACLAPWPAFNSTIWLLWLLHCQSPKNLINLFTLSLL